MYANRYMEKANQLYLKLIVFLLVILTHFYLLIN